jgi:hypothetical protein
LNNIYLEDATFIESYMNYLLVITSSYKMIILDVNLKEKVLDANLSISEFTKIDSVVFLDLERIILCLSQEDNKDNKKTYCIYNKNLNLLFQIDYSQEIQNIITSGLEENKNIKTIYNSLLRDHIFQSYFINLIPEENDKRKLDNKNINFELNCLQEKILFNKDLNQKNEFIMFFRKFIIQLIKNGFYFQLFDYLYYICCVNRKSLFQIVVKFNLNLGGQK